MSFDYKTITPTITPQVTQNPFSILHNFQHQINTLFDANVHVIETINILIDKVVELNTLLDLLKTKVEELEKSDTTSQQINDIQETMSNLQDEVTPFILQIKKKNHGIRRKS